jgi:hypothetical protein
MGRYRHPSVPGATRKDLKYWRARQARLNPTTPLLQQVKDFFINTMFNLRKKVRWPWFDFQSD